MTEASPQAKELFLAEFYKARSQFGETPAQDIRAAGKPTKAHPNGEDELWWLSEGPKMVQRWIDWRKSSPWEIWIAPDGRPGIELELTPEFGGIPVRMFIDRVFRIPSTGRLVIVDLKSGKRTPASDIQLAFYAAGIRATYGDYGHAELGAYWMARTGELSPVAEIGRFTLPLLTHWVQQFAFARENHIFIPHLTELCRACGVRQYCLAYGGKKSELDSDFESSAAIPF